jgi:hypothetical protein
MSLGLILVSMSANDPPKRRFQSKLNTFQISPTPIFAGSLADIATSPRDVRCYTFLPAPKVVNIIQTHARRGPSLIPRDAGRHSHIRGVPPWIKNVQ